MSTGQSVYSFVQCVLLCGPGILAAKVQRQDSLARFLSQRPNRKELVERNIIPVSEMERQEQKVFINNKLNRSVSRAAQSVFIVCPR